MDADAGRLHLFGQLGFLAVIAEYLKDFFVCQMDVAQVEFVPKAILSLLLASLSSLSVLFNQVSRALSFAVHVQT